MSNYLPRKILLVNTFDKIIDNVAWFKGISEWNLCHKIIDDIYRTGNVWSE